MITIPTINQIYTGIISNLEAQYNISIPLIGKNFLRCVAIVEAGKQKLYYLAIANLQKQVAPDTADPESQGGTLERFGRLKLQRDPFQAVAAQYVVQVTGTVGGIIAASTTFKSDDTSQNPGNLYILDNAYTLISTTDSITLRALTAGLEGALNLADTLTATAPIALVNASAAVLSVAIEPLAAETTDEYRAATVASYQLQPQGGSSSDYRLWSQDVQGVAKVYPYADSEESNEINLFIEAIAADSVDGKGTPSASLINAVDVAVELRRPLGVFEVNYLPVNVRQVDINITGFVGITAGQKTLIFNAVQAQINLIRPFIAGADILSNKNDILDSNKIISIVLGVTTGAVFGAVTIKIDSVVMNTFTFLNGDIPYLNSITYV